MCLNVCHSMQANSVEAAFRPAFEEIARRSSATKGVTRETTYFARDAQDTAAQPFRQPGQVWALVSFGTAVLAPRPAEPTRPALRVYGAFATKGEATEHAEVVRDVDATCSLVAVRTHEWVLMPATEATRDDPDESTRRTEARLQAHRTRQAEDGAEFDRVVHERLARPDAAPADEPSEYDDAEEEVYGPPKRLRAGAEVRGQAAVALCVVPDGTTGECLVKVLGCFESVAEADAWSRNVATRHITDDDVYVAPTCEWLYPNGIAKTGATHYRVDELQRIMDAAARNPQAVRDYKAWKLEQDRQTCVEEEADEEGTTEGVDPATP